MFLMVAAYSLVAALYIHVDAYHEAEEMCPSKIVHVEVRYDELEQYLKELVGHRKERQAWTCRNSRDSS